MRRLLAVAMLVVALAWGAVPSPAEARSVGNPVGAAGDNGDLVECPANEVLVGFTGRTGLWIDQIQLECATLFDDGGLGAPHPYGAAYGGGGGGPSSGVCTQGRIAGVEIELTGDSKKVAYLTFACVDRSGQRTRGFFGGSQAETASSHQSCGLFRGCDPNSINTPAQSCSNGEPSTGLSVRYGAHVNAVGLVCDQRQPVAVAHAAPPPPPPPPAPGPPEKPIKHTGRAGDGGTGSSVSIADFTASEWQVASTPGIPFHLVMHEDEGPGAMWGEMKFDDPHWNGTLIGKLQGSIFHFTYEQVDAGISGSGALLLTVAKTIAGEVTTNEDPPRTFKWFGHH